MRQGLRAADADGLEAVSEGREELVELRVADDEGRLDAEHARVDVGAGDQDLPGEELGGHAIGSPLENHDELGVRDDPNYGDNNAIHLRAVAISPQPRNQAEVEGLVLDAIRARAKWLGFASLSSLIESHVVEAGPAWLRTTAACRR